VPLVPGGINTLAKKGVQQTNNESSRIPNDKFDLFRSEEKAERRPNGGSSINRLGSLIDSEEIPGAQRSDQSLINAQANLSFQVGAAVGEGASLIVDDQEHDEDEEEDLSQEQDDIVSYKSPSSGGLSRNLTFFKK